MRLIKFSHFGKNTGVLCLKSIADDKIEGGEKCQKGPEEGWEGLRGMHLFYFSISISNDCYSKEQILERCSDLVSNHVSQQKEQRESFVSTWGHQNLKKHLNSFLPQRSRGLLDSFNCWINRLDFIAGKREF